MVSLGRAETVHGNVKGRSSEFPWTWWRALEIRT
jgi:hypothetical protein